jgi:hypothetical protein
VQRPQPQNFYRGKSTRISKTLWWNLTSIILVTYSAKRMYVVDTVRIQHRISHGSCTGQVTQVACNIEVMVFRKSHSHLFGVHFPKNLATYHSNIGVQLRRRLRLITYLTSPFEEVGKLSGCFGSAFSLMGLWLACRSILYLSRCYLLQQLKHLATRKTSSPPSTYLRALLFVGANKTTSFIT